jgi:hypothetical protein
LKVRSIEFFHNNDHTFCVVKASREIRVMSGVKLTSISLMADGSFSPAFIAKLESKKTEHFKLTGSTVKHPKDKFNVDIANKHALEDAVKELVKTDRAAIWAWFLHHPVSDTYEELPF